MKRTCFLYIDRFVRLLIALGLLLSSAGATTVRAAPVVEREYSLYHKTAIKRILGAVINPPIGQTWRMYYHANGQPIAMREISSQGASNTLTFLHQDHLGSTTLTTNSSGSVVSRQAYYPYGELRWGTGTLATTIGYTGQRRDTGLGSLMFYNARYYSPLLSRFVSADSIAQGSNVLTINSLDNESAKVFLSKEKQTVPLSPQVLNRFSYTYNNPVRYTDPSGHFVPCENVCSLTNILWLVFTAVFNLPTSTDISQNGPANSVAVQASCGVLLGICTVDNGILRGTTNGEMRTDGVVVFGSSILSSPICPNCGAANPTILRSSGGIANRQHVLNPGDIGADGISAMCQSCTTQSGKFWGRTTEEIMAFAEGLGLDPSKAVVYTPQFGGEGHYSLFIDAIDENGYLMAQYAQKIDEFLRGGNVIKQ